MYTQLKSASIITAVLPEAYIQRTLDKLKQAGHNVIRWHARGSLQDTRWYRKLFPPISPEKGVIRLLVLDGEVDQVEHIIIEEGNLHRQGTGAVYSTPCNEIHIGGRFQSSCNANETVDMSASTSMKENLDVIHCIVDKNQTEKIAKAAIHAGAHGPIVHYCEGRGLRDRLGWLRITKQNEKEVLTVIVDNADADNVFDAMANAGRPDLPGRGFMYQMPVEKGLFNLPSHFDKHRNAANMQQVISAIDHLMGDDHWRDQTVFDIGGTGKSAGLSFVKKAREKKILEDQVCLSAIVDREHAEELMGIMLDSGAPGLNISYCQYITSDTQCIHEEVNLVTEYGIILCLVNAEQAYKILIQLKNQAEKAGIEDLCLFLQPVLKVMTYFHPIHSEKNSNANVRKRDPSHFID